MNRQTLFFKATVIFFIIGILIGYIFRSGQDKILDSPITRVDIPKAQSVIFLLDSLSDFEKVTITQGLEDLTYTENIDSATFREYIINARLMISAVYPEENKEFSASYIDLSRLQDKFNEDN